MAGAFALIVTPERTDGRRRAEALAAAMTAFPARQGHRLLEPEAGRVFLGAVANRDPALTLPRRILTAGPLVCACEGWLVRSLADCGAEEAIAREAWAEAVLAAYRKFGADFPAALDGQYNALVWDGEANRLVVANSRCCHTQLYLHRARDHFLAGTMLGPLTATGLFHPEPDPMAVATFLAYGQYFGRATFLRDVECLEPASVLVIELAAPDWARPASRRYWDYDAMGEPLSGLPAGREADEVAEVLRAAARRVLRRPGRYVAGLSGGYDSRIMIGLAAPLVPGLKAWTFGTPEAPDRLTAARICRHLGIEHLVYETHPQAIPAAAPTYVDLVDGAVTSEFAYGLERARDLGDRADIVLNGYAGEVMLRGIMLNLGQRAARDHLLYRLGRGPAAPHPVLERNRDAASLTAYVQKKYGGLSRLAAATDPAPPAFPALAGADFAAMAGRIPSHLQPEKWILENRGNRWTMMGIIFDRHFYEDASVFYDVEFLTRCFRVPLARRRRGRLYAAVARRLMPDLARIPSGNTGLPVTAPPWRLELGKVERRLRLALGGRPPARSTGSDFGAWLRGPLREWIGDFVGEGRTRSRSLWRAEAIDVLLRDHLAGRGDRSRELGLLVTAELFWRRWVDAGEGGR